MPKTPAQHAETDRIDIGDFFAEPSPSEPSLFSVYTAVDPLLGDLPEHVGDLTPVAARSWRCAAVAAHHFADRTHHLARALDAAGECVTALERTIATMSRTMEDLLRADAANPTTTHPDAARRHARALLDALADTPENPPIPQPGRQNGPLFDADAHLPEARHPGGRGAHRRSLDEH